MTSANVQACVRKHADALLDGQQHSAESLYASVTARVGDEARRAQEDVDYVPRDDRTWVNSAWAGRNQALTEALKVRDWLAGVTPSELVVMLDEWQAAETAHLVSERDYVPREDRADLTRVWLERRDAAGRALARATVHARWRQRDRAPREI